MNWDAIGAVGEILGALAVVGSLIYVGRQFRHSSTHSLHSLYAQTVSNFSANPANADVIFRGNNDPSQLTDSERYHYTMLLHDLHNAVSVNWEQYQRGLINEEAKDRLLKVAALYISSPGGRAWWTGELNGFRMSEFFPVTYVDVIESLVSVSSLAVAPDA